MSKGKVCIASMWIALWFTMAWMPQCQAQAPVAVQKVQLAEGIYQFSSGPDGYVHNDNAIVVVDDSDVLVFDTFSRQSIARTLLAEIRKLTNKPVRYIVNSHHHPDHWSGNEVFVEAFPGVEIIATEEAREFMLNIENSWPSVWTKNLARAQEALDQEVRTGKLPDGSALAADQRKSDEEEVGLLRDWVGELLKVKRTHPTLTYSDSLILHHGGREFRFMEVLGDATGTTVLYLPKEKILLTGDSVHAPLPDFNFNLPLSGLNKTLKRFAAMDVDVIVPGHGAALHDKSLLRLQIELQDSVIRQVGEIVKRGTVTVEEMQKIVDVEAIRAKFPQQDEQFAAQFKRLVGRMVENASKEARDGRKWEQ